MKNFLNRRLLIAGILNLIFGTFITFSHWKNGNILIGMGAFMLAVYLILRLKSAQLFEDQHNFKRNSIGYWLFAAVIFAGFALMLFNSIEYPYAGALFIVAGIVGYLWMVMREYRMVRKA